MSGAVVEKHRAEGAARSVGIDNRQHIHSKMLGLPIAGRVGGGKEAARIAEGGADGAHLFWSDYRHDGGGWVELGDASGRINGETYGDSGGGTGRFDTGRTADHGREEQRVQRAPSVQLLAVDGEPVRSGAQRDSPADDTGLPVVFGVAPAGHGALYIICGLAGGLEVAVKATAPRAQAAA
jgi:hypothetical protein